MHTRRIRTAATTALIGLIAAACGTSDATGPAPQPSSLASAEAPLLLGSILPQNAVGVQWARPLAGAVTTSADIGINGGTLELKATGLKVIFPKYALLKTTRISVTALPGKVVAYDFQPHGTIFLAPVRMEQDYRLFSTTNTNYSSFQLGYFIDQSLLNPLLGTALVSEVLPILVDITGSKVKMDIRHFSGYMVSSGRSR